MINLTNTITSSINLNVLWKIQGFYLWKEYFEKLDYQISFWEEEESWATILKEDNIVGYIWYENPLVILKEPFIGLHDCVVETSAVILIHNDFSEKIFNIDDGIKEKYFPHLDILFSIDDLWFYSNSV